MNVLFVYIENLLSDWNLHKSALNQTGCPHPDLNMITNAKQEQILNDIKTLYDSSYSVMITDKDAEAKKVCEYISSKMNLLMPMLASQFNNHVSEPFHLQTSFS